MFKILNNVKTNWFHFIDEQLKLPYMVDIQSFLSLQNEKDIFPTQENVFRAFNFFNIEDTKMVLFGQDPYHGDGQANGLAFSVNKIMKTPPSLKNIFKKIYIDLGIKRMNPDLSDWAQQGMLLLNTSLTVKKSIANSHSKIGWINFTKNVIEKLNNNENKIIFILLGNDAYKLEPYINKKHLIIKSCHPSPLSANRCGFFDDSLFCDINNKFKEINNKEFKWI